MDRSIARSHASLQLCDMVIRLGNLGSLLWDSGAREEALKLDELLFELVQVRREILELARQSGVPAALEHLVDPAEPELPF